MKDCLFSGSCSICSMRRTIFRLGFFAAFRFPAFGCSRSSVRVRDNAEFDIAENTYTGSHRNGQYVLTMAGVK
jgi:hypothetical protein